MADNDTTDANDIVDPANTEKIYGDKLDEEEEVPGQQETIETSEPDNSALAEQNLYPDAQ